MTYHVLPEADEEAITAALWYEDREPGLGSVFMEEVRRVFDEIRESPRSFPRLEWTDRRLMLCRSMLRRFPYAVIFQSRLDEVPGRCSLAYASKTSVLAGSG